VTVRGRLVPRLASLALAAVLAGCASQQPIDFDRAQLMPEPAAKAIIRSLVPRYDGGTLLQAGPAKFEPVPIRSIKLVYFTAANAIFLEAGSFAFSWDIGVICNGTAEKARQLAEALTALGATVDLYRTPTLNSYDYCR
jgi:hypothetical protein